MQVNTYAHSGRCDAFGGAGGWIAEEIPLRELSVAVGTSIRKAGSKTKQKESVNQKQNSTLSKYPLYNIWFIGLIYATPTGA